MVEDIGQVVYSKQVIDFVAVANEFCSFIDEADKHTRKKFVDILHKILPLVYLKAAMLPSMMDEEIEYPEKFMTEVDYHFLQSKLQRKMGAFDSYQEVFDPNFQFSEAPLEASISENICDVYQDLKDFVMAYRVGNVELMSGAIFECQSNFKEYWGQKLTNCMRALHQLNYGEADLDEELEPTSKQTKSSTSVKDSWLSRHYDSYQDDESRFSEE